MKWIKKLPMVLVGVLLALLGCSAMLDAITPCYIPPMLIEYAKAEPTTFMPYTTLFDLQRLDRLVKWEFQKEQIEYGFIKELSQIHQFAARELQTKFMVPAISGLMSMGAFGVGWLKVSKPSDKKKIIEAEAKNGAK